MPAPAAAPMEPQSSRSLPGFKEGTQPVGLVHASGGSASRLSGGSLHQGVNREGVAGALAVLQAMGGWAEEEGLSGGCRRMQGLCVPLSLILRPFCSGAFLECSRTKRCCPPPHSPTHTHTHTHDTIASR